MLWLHFGNSVKGNMDRDLFILTKNCFPKREQQQGQGRRELFSFRNDGFPAVFGEELVLEGVNEPFTIHQSLLVSCPLQSPALAIPVPKEDIIYFPTLYLS
jgi:hypothetical protein